MTEGQVFLTVAKLLYTLLETQTNAGGSEKGQNWCYWVNETLCPKTFV